MANSASKRWRNPESEVVPELIEGNTERAFRFTSGKVVPIGDPDCWPGTPYAYVVRKEWWQLLRTIDWSVLFTGTFRFRGRSAPRADDAFKLTGTVANCVARALYGQHYLRQGQPGVGWFAVVERHLSGSPHVHALFAGIPPSSITVARKVMMDCWTRLAGRCDSEAIRDLDRVIVYVSKDLPRNAEWAFSVNIKLFR